MNTLEVQCTIRHVQSLFKVKVWYTEGSLANWIVHLASELYLGVHRPKHTYQVGISLYMYLTFVHFLQRHTRNRT